MSQTDRQDALMRLDIVSDVICPWCYIGKRHLERALEVLRTEGLHFSVHWNAYQLNPDMPAGGVERSSYRAAKFGSIERSRELDVQVAEAGARTGLAFRHDLMLRTPNTVDAHRLIYRAGRDGAQHPVMEAIFQSYFTQGGDVGDHGVLAACAAEGGMNAEEVRTFLDSDLYRAEVLAMDHAARSAGVNGVPSFFLNGYGLFSGALTAEDMMAALRRAHGILLSKAA